MNRALGHLCAHIGWTGPGEPPEDGEMTLSSRHRIRNSSPGGLRPSTLPLGHGVSPQYWLSHVDGEETFLFLSNRREPNSGVKGSGANHHPRAPALNLSSCPANTRHWPNACLKLGQRRRRWTNNKLTLAWRLMFAYCLITDPSAISRGMTVRHVWCCHIW